jgi:hypothetical protein
MVNPVIIDNKVIFENFLGEEINISNSDFNLNNIEVEVD